MAHILFITPFYLPEKGAAVVRISETAQGLLKHGHQVTVLTTRPSYPEGIVPEEYRRYLLRREVINEVQVVRVWSYVSQHKGLLRRIVAEASFCVFALLLGSYTVRQPDIIVVQSPPLFDAIAGRLLAWFKRCPFIFMVSDLWPDSAIELGALHNTVLIRLAEWLEISTYKHAGLVWALSEGIKHRIERKIFKHSFSAEHVFCLTNGADLTRFYPLPQDLARQELGWDKRYTILYLGTYGLSHGLITVLEAAEQLLDNPNIHFIFIGDGTEKAKLISQAHQRKLSNITFLRAQPHERVPLLLAGADVCLVPMRKLPLFADRLPIKMFEVMACARPILLGVDGEARRIAEQEADAAIYVEPENSSALVSAILYLNSNPQIGITLGQRGRAFVEKHFDRSQLVAKLDTRIKAFLEKNDAPFESSNHSGSDNSNNMSTSLTQHAKQISR
jgi:glycosyltransferase involved in cell wall biosynthesis